VGSHARSLVVIQGQGVLAPMRVVREVLWMPLVHCYTITWAFLRAFLKAFLWRILQKKIEIHYRTKTFRTTSNILQKVGCASRKLDGARE
jgi:hypothetical protein